MYLVTVINKVIVARLFGNGRRGLWDLDVLQVQEAELHLHGEQCVHVGLGVVAGHLLAQQSIQTVRPHAVLVELQSSVSIILFFKANVLFLYIS